MLKNRGALLALIALVLTATGAEWWEISFPAHPPKDHPIETSEQGKSAQAPEKCSGILASVSCWFERDHGGLEAASTVVIALFTIVLGTGTVILVRDGRKHSERQLRAYIGFREGNIIDFDTGCPILQAKFSNDGQTPAYAVQLSTLIRMVSLPPDPKIFSEKLEYTKTIGVVGPHGHFHYRCALNQPEITASHKALIRKGKWGIFAFGRIEYRDTFRKSQRTEFRVVYNGSDPAARDGSLALCDEGNDTS